jgi:hypothetical protein
MVLLLEGIHTTVLYAKSHLFRDQRLTEVSDMPLVSGWAFYLDSDDIVTCDGR